MGKKIWIFLPVSAIVLSLLIGGIIKSRAEIREVYNIKDNVLISYDGTESHAAIPGGVKVIGRQAFENNKTLVSVSIPGSVTRIEYAAFAGCDSLSSIEIPDSVTELEDSVFRSCRSLSNVKLGKNLKTIGAGVFGDCDVLAGVDTGGNTEFVMFGGGLYDSGCKKLYQFFGGSADTIFNAPSTLKEIGRYAFWGADYLEMIAVPAVDRINDHAFSNAAGLRFVTIQVPTNEIGVKAFEDCTRLEQIVTPISLKSIHDTAFDGVPKSAVFVCENTSAACKWAVDHGFLQSESARDIVVVQSRNVAVPTPIDMAQTTEIQSGEAAQQSIGTEPDTREGILLGGTTVVTDRAYVDVNGMKVNEGSAAPTPASFDGTVPAYVHYQDENMIKYGFEDFEFVTKIGDFALARSNVSEVTIPEGATEIGKGAFYHCDKLGTINIPSTVTKVGAHAFDHTPWYKAWEADKAAGDWLIVGDGVAVGYKGKESAPKIPEKVKSVAEGVL
ncbi:MAG: leucine-rich repeat domain-containing protein [Lachnospiraceae bacterium]|nr:leucine-rich repeat domain-containing protein [Lachnospiraceae bacterium]